MIFFYQKDINEKNTGKANDICPGLKDGVSQVKEGLGSP